MNHDQVVKFRVIDSISKCKHIPLDRDKRTHKIAWYMDTEMQREKNPDQVAETIQDLQEQIQDLYKELTQQKKRANEGLAGWLRRHIW